MAQNNGVVTEKIKLKVTPNAADDFRNAPKTHALIIGVSNYKNASSAFRSLDQPIKDAQQLYDLLTVKYRINSNDVIFLKDPNRVEIIDTLAFLARTIKNKESLLVFYAGHGFYDDKLQVGYWIPSDAINRRVSTYLSNSQLRDFLKGIPSQHTLLITDACFGGSIFSAKRATLSTDEVLQFRDVYRTKSRKAITSGNLVEVPDNSVFIKALLTVLAENEKPFISAQYLYTQIFNKLQSNRQLPLYGPIEDAGDEGLGGSFVFIKRD